MNPAGGVLASVVIAAHDEEAVILRCLEALTYAAAPGELDIVVVCNGCHDRTAERARACFYPVRVVETPLASKPEALNLGDEVARCFPRFYVDADVVVDTAALRRVAQRLAGGEVHAAAPRIAVDCAGAGWITRGYYATWLRLPYAGQHGIGAGAYGLSQAGRRRFGRFPDVIADDCFVRLHFEAQEIENVAEESFSMTAPRRLRDLVSVLARQIAGSWEMQSRHPERLRAERRWHWRAFLRLLTRPETCVPAGIYLAVKAAAALVYCWRRLRGRSRVWSRDASSRIAAPSAALPRQEGLSVSRSR